MKIIIGIFISVSALVAGVHCSSGTWNGTTCSDGTRPRTYVVCGRNSTDMSCTGATGMGLQSEIQAAINDAELGDTIKLEAGRTWTIAGEHIVIFRRRGTGWLTITTTADDKLPNPGTRITPAYKPLLPVLQIATSNKAAIAIAGTTDPTENIYLRGLLFTVDPASATSTNYSRGPLLIGNGQGAVASSAGIPDFVRSKISAAAPAGQPVLSLTNVSWIQPGMEIGINPQTGTKETGTVQAVGPGSTVTLTAPLKYSHAINEPFVDLLVSSDQQPTNIVVQHCVFTQDWLHQPNRMISVHARDVTIRDNFIEGGMKYSSDAQGIWGANSVGPHVFENNYIQGSSENVMFAGIYPGGDYHPKNVLFRYNYLPHIMERERNGPWTPNTMVFRGRHLHRSNESPSTTGVTAFFVATNTGCTSDVEPPWPAVIGTSVTETGVVPPDCPAGSVPVTWRMVGNGNNKPLSKNNMEWKSGIDWITRWNVFDDFWDDYVYGGQPVSVNIKAENRDPNENSCNYSGDYSKCYGARTERITFEYNIIRNRNAGCLTMGGGTRGIPQGYGGHIIRHNLCISTEQATRTPSVSQLAFGLSTDLTGPKVPWGDFVVENNTFFSPFTLPTRSINIENQNGAKFLGPNRMRYNIFTRGAMAGLKANGVLNVFTGTEGMDSIDFLLNCGGTCGAEQWAENALIGAAASAYSSDTLTNCPTAAACVTSVSTPPNWQFTGKQTAGVFSVPLFRDVASGNLRIHPGHPWSRSGSNGSGVGVDFSQLPEIVNLSVMPTATSVLFTWSVTEPIADIPCVIEVNTSPDMEGSYAGELSRIDMYYRQDADDHPANVRAGLHRMVTVGRSVPLDSGRTYFYRLQCGGDARRGSFRTVGQAVGIAEQTITRVLTSPQATSMVVEYGTSYDRVTDAIRDGGTVRASCAPGEPCSVSFPLDRRDVGYYRWKELDNEGSVVASGLVLPLVAP